MMHQKNLAEFLHENNEHLLTIVLTYFNVVDLQLVFAHLSRYVSMHIRRTQQLYFYLSDADDNWRGKIVPNLYIFRLL
jgi:hypothetical protein